MGQKRKAAGRGLAIVLAGLLSFEQFIPVNVLAAEENIIPVDEVTETVWKISDTDPSIEPGIIVAEDEDLPDPVELNDGADGIQIPNEEDTEDCVLILTEKNDESHESIIDSDGNEALLAADDPIGRNLTWEITGTSPNQVLTVSGTGAMYDFSTSDPAPWKSSATSIRSIVLPEGLTHIGNYAFDGFTAVSGDLTLPSTLESIGDYAFRNCTFNNESIEIPDGITKIGQYAFYGCTGLSGDLTIPGNVTTIGAYAFGGCNGMKGNLIVSSGVKTIGESAFRECSGFTGDLVLPGSLTTLGQYAFYNCSGMKGSLTIRTGLGKIPQYTFYGCGFTGDVALSSVLKSIGESAFQGCSGIGSVIIPPLVTTINSYAFYGCTKLRDVYFEGNTPSTIYKSTLSPSFSGNTNLTLYYIDGMTGWTTPTWNGYATQAIKESDIPANNNADERLEDKDFNGDKCGSNLTWRITGQPDDLTLTISGTGAMYDFTVGTGAEPVPWYYWRNDIRHLVLPEGLTHIGNYSFDGLAVVSGDLTLPSTLESIGDYAFRNCTFNNESIEIPDGITKIGQYAFYGCTGLSGDLTIPGNVTTIGAYAFGGCNGMKGNLIVSSGVKTIGESAFRECSGFTGDLVLPGSLTTLGQYAFYNCSGMKGSLTIRTGLGKIPQYTFYGCGFTGDVALSSVLKSIGESAFQGCSGIGSVIIPPLVTTINSYAFYGCTKLRDVYFEGNTPSTIYKSTLSPSFSGNTNLTLYYIDGMTGWTTPTWNGYSTATYTAADKITSIRLYRNGVELGQYTLELGEGETETLTASVLPCDASQSVTWMSSDANVATVTDGRITAVKGGYAVITVSSADGSVSAFCEVKVNGEPAVETISVTGIELDKTELTLNIDGTAALKATVLPANATTPTISWSSDKPEIASVDQIGNVTGIAPGVAVITATTLDGGKTASCTVTVTEESRTIIVTFDVNGGDALSAEQSARKVTIGEPYGELPVPIREGYSFDGWYTELTDGSRVISETIITSEHDHALYAHWIEDEIEDPEPEEPKSDDPEKEISEYVVFFYDSDEMIVSETVLSDETVTNIPIMGDNFIGWYDDVTDKLWDPTTPVTRSMKLYARFRAVEEETQEESGRDPGLIISEEEHVYMVKGQSYAFEALDTDNKAIIWKVSESGKNVVKISSKYKAKATAITDTAVEMDGDTGIYVYNGNSEADYKKRYTVHIIDPYISLLNRTGDDEEHIAVTNPITVLTGSKMELKLNVDGVENDEWEDLYAVSWTSSNDEIAKVDDGTVWAYSKGTAKITAYVNGKSLSCTIKVVDTMSPGKLSDTADLTLTPLQSVSLKFEDKTFKMKNLIWSNGTEEGMAVSKNKNGAVTFYQDDVVRVTPSGKITAVGTGTTTLTATSALAGSSKTFTVTVNKPAGSILYINKGKTKAVKFYNVKASKVSWKLASSEMVEYVGDMDKGKAKGRETGIARVNGIYAPYSYTDENGRVWGAGITYTATIYVEDPVLNGNGEVEISNKTATSGKLNLNKGDSVAVKVDGVWQPVIFTSSKPAVAFVDDAGIVNARGIGKATLSTRINGKKLTIAVTVQ